MQYIFWVATSRKSSFAFFNAAAFSLCVVIYFAGSEERIETSESFELVCVKRRENLFFFPTSGSALLQHEQVQLAHYVFISTKPLSARRTYSSSFEDTEKKK
jgi:hypothetical protein